MSENGPKTMGENLRDLSERIEREKTKLKFKLWTMSDGAESHYCYFQILEQAENLVIKEVGDWLLNVKIQANQSVNYSCPDMYLRGSYTDQNMRISQKRFPSPEEADDYKKLILDSLEAALCEPGEPKQGEEALFWDFGGRAGSPHIFLADLGKQIEYRYTVVHESDREEYLSGSGGIRIVNHANMNPISQGIEALDNDVYMIR